MPPFIMALMQFSSTACALVAGVFPAFSDFIMRSLTSPSGDGGVEAIQVINREVFRRAFMALFIGLAPISLLVGGDAWITPSGPCSLPVFLAAIFDLVGCFGVAIACN